jgi:hypothetical protein
VDIGSTSYYPSNTTLDSTETNPGITYRQHLIETVVSAIIVKYDPLLQDFMAHTIAQKAIAIVDAVLQIENGK